MEGLAILTLEPVREQGFRDPEGAWDLVGARERSAGVGSC